MKIYVHNKYKKITRIEFCCDIMSHAIICGEIQISRDDRNYLVFKVGDYRLSHCGHCGAKIESDCIIGEEEYIPTWQPISTAPKDRYILIRTNGNLPYIVKWKEKLAPLASEAELPEANRSGWVKNSGTNMGLCDSYKWADIPS
jgi:hypothetical protein